MVGGGFWCLKEGAVYGEVVGDWGVVVDAGFCS